MCDCLPSVERATRQRDGGTEIRLRTSIILCGANILLGQRAD